MLNKWYTLIYDDVLYHITLITKQRENMNKYNKH